jgi:hypothetical protein
LIDYVKLLASKSLCCKCVDMVRSFRHHHIDMLSRLINNNNQFSFIDLILLANREQLLIIKIKFSWNQMDYTFFEKQMDAIKNEKNLWGQQ